MSNIAVIILAAGRGKRAGSGLPKTYRHPKGAPILRQSILAFKIHEINYIQCVIHPDDASLFKDVTHGLDLPNPVYGGAERALSVQAGLNALPDDIDRILIHDAARPHVSKEVIKRVIMGLDEADGVIPAMPVIDALWQVDNDQLVTPVARENLMRAQTPQGFHLKAYGPIAAKNPNARDDAELAVAAGLNVKYVLGDVNNIKYTYPEDFK